MKFLFFILTSTFFCISLFSEEPQLKGTLIERIKEEKPGSLANR